jgi:hypothetical protein
LFDHAFKLLKAEDFRANKHTVATICGLPRNECIHHVLCVSSTPTHPRFSGQAYLLL